MHDFCGHTYPFSFTYNGEDSGTFLGKWKKEIVRQEEIGDCRTFTVTTLTDPETGLKLMWERTEFCEYQAYDWVLYFENPTDKETPMIENIQALSIEYDCPINEETPYIVHRVGGGICDPRDFESTLIPLGPAFAKVMLSAEGGRSSNRDFPFFRLDTGEGSAIIAVGWSGQWQASMVYLDADEKLSVTAGMEHTRFKLLPGEKVRQPSILTLVHEGTENRFEVNNRCRQLILNHYVPKYQGKTPEPFLYCNTCFTRKGTWLNECNAENQISLIKALQPYGVQAVLTDAGWFTGGWPDGAGNWDPDPVKYPGGMGQVAKAAFDRGMIYGLWFEPERVMKGTDIHKKHPEWVLWNTNRFEKHTNQKIETKGLLNMALQEARDYFFDIVAGLLSLPGLKVYRQDFNMNPLNWWKSSDEEDRQGITEIKYIEGLYAYWDRLRREYPDIFMIDCASGGRRIDLESIKRFHVHQKSDYWFHNITNQGSLQTLSQYLPNAIIMEPMNRLDDLSFHSAMAATLNLGWIADADDFDRENAKKISDIYLNYRHLLNGDFYPLTDYSISPHHWLASQYHRSDLKEGMVLAFRRSVCEKGSIAVTLSGVSADKQYELTHFPEETTETVSGEVLMQGFEISIENTPASKLIAYKECGEK